jgi:hypothetical protein
MAAIELVKLAQVLPAVLVADTTAEISSLINPPIVNIEAGAVARFRSQATQSLTIAGEAYVPLNSGVRTRLWCFATRSVRIRWRWSSVRPIWRCPSRYGSSPRV